MRFGTKQIDNVVVTAAMAVATVTASACGPARNEQAPTEPPVTTAGGMDSGGLSAGQRGNESPNGVVTTTIGEFRNVRSKTPLTHIFQPARDGVPEKLFIRHYLETSTGQSVVFEFDYSDGVRSFPIVENGFLAITRNGTDLIAKAGKVMIEPVNDGALKVSLDQIAVAADNNGDSLNSLETIGSGWVLGPLRRACLEAGDVPESTDAPGVEPVTSAPTSTRDAAWIASFCGN